jgi:hypothetical protein
MHFILFIPYNKMKKRTTNFQMKRQAANLIGIMLMLLVTNTFGQTWSSTGSLAEARDYHCSTLLSDGKVLISGGAAWVNKFETR